MTVWFVLSNKNNQMQETYRLRGRH